MKLTLKDFKIPVFFLIGIFIISCQRPSVIKGQIHVSEGLPLKQNLGFVLNRVKTNDAYEYSVTTKADGSFRLKVKEKGEFYIFISSFNSSLVMNEDLSFSQTYQINSKNPIEINNIYISEKFSIETTEGEEITDNVNKISWKYVQDANFYSVYLIKNGMKKREIGMHFVTTENSCKLNDNFSLISFDRTLSPEDILKLAPFYRIRSPNKTGEYILRIDAVKFLPNGMETFIGVSKEYDVKFKDFISE